MRAGLYAVNRRRQAITITAYPANRAVASRSQADNIIRSDQCARELTKTGAQFEEVQRQERAAGRSLRLLPDPTLYDAPQIMSRHAASRADPVRMNGRILGWRLRLSGASRTGRGITPAPTVDARVRWTDCRQNSYGCARHGGLTL